MVRVRRKGIFYLIQGDEAKDLAPKLGLKLLEKKTTGPAGDVDVKISCGFPKSGLDKYIGKLVRLGFNQRNRNREGRFDDAFNQTLRLEKWSGC